MCVDTAIGISCTSLKGHKIMGCCIFVELDVLSFLCDVVQASYGMCFQQSLLPGMCEQLMLVSYFVDEVQRQNVRVAAASAVCMT